MSRTESTLQMSIHDLLSRCGVFHFAPLNETAMMILKMFKVPDKTCYCIINYLKKMGLTSGIPDLLILHNSTVYFLELKSENGKLSDVQKIIHAALSARGYSVATVYNFEQAYGKLKEWGMV
jgi:hypothetical protein